MYRTIKVTVPVSYLTASARATERGGSLAAALAMPAGYPVAEEPDYGHLRLVAAEDPVGLGVERARYREGMRNYTSLEELTKEQVAARDEAARRRNATTLTAAAAGGRKCGCCGAWVNQLYSSCQRQR